MKKILFLFSTFIFVTSSYAVVDSNDERALGEELFKKLKCTMCHKKSTKSIGPTIEEVGKKYSGLERQLFMYLQGKSHPIVNPAKAYTMNAQLLKLKSLNKKKIKAISRYIVTISDREF